MYTYTKTHINIHKIQHSMWTNRASTRYVNDLNVFKYGFWWPFMILDSYRLCYLDRL